MSLQFVIDGYNIINHPQFGKSANKRTRSPLFALLDVIKTKRLCGSTRNGITIVFDGYINEPQLCQYRDEIKVVFSYDETADEEIKRIIERAKNKKNMVVVSDDREIADFAKISGAKPLSVNEFLKPAIEDRNESLRLREDSFKQQLNYSQIQAINEELKKKWLK